MIYRLALGSFAPITTIKTEITQEDFAAFSRFVLKRVPRSWTPLIVEWVIIFFITLGLTAAGLVSHVISFMVGFVFATLSIPIVMALQRRKLLPTGDGFILGPRSISVSDDGIREQSTKHESFFHWETIQAIETTAQHIFVMVDRGAGIIIPVRSFANDEDRNQFVVELQQRLSASH